MLINVKDFKRNLCLLLGLVAGMGIMTASQVSAQAPTVLRNFGTNDSTPSAGLVLSGTTLYGTTSLGGNGKNGTIFRINSDGSGYTNLYHFTSTSPVGQRTNSDGASPYGALVLSGNTLFGTAYEGGAWGNGTVFTVNTDGTGFVTLHSFPAGEGSRLTNSEGGAPYAGLVLSGNTLFGTTRFGGLLGKGVVYAINVDGSGFTNLHNFGAPNHAATNIDGMKMFGGLVLSGDTLFGVADQGGLSSNGTVFSLKTDGTDFTVLHTFVGTDGANPSCTLTLSNGTLYGTTARGGTMGGGTVFAIQTDGSGFTKLHDFEPSDYSSDSNDGGALPIASPILLGNTLYGAAYAGGTAAGGTLYRVGTDGSGFAVLHDFGPGNLSTNAEGRGPHGIILSGDNLYGTATTGGSSSKGTLFSVSILPQLEISPSGGNVVLTWPMDPSGFALQSSTNFGATAAWSDVSPAPVIVNGQYTVTNAISGAQLFYRLIK